MAKPVYSIFEAAKTGRLGSVFLGQTKNELLHANPWLRAAPKDWYQEGSIDGDYTGCWYDFRPYYEIKLYTTEKPYHVTAIEFPLPDVLDVHIYNTPDYFPYHPSYLEEVGTKNPLDLFGFLVDLGGLYSDALLRDCEDILHGRDLKVLKPYVHDFLSEEFRLRVDTYLELLFGRLEEEDYFSLYRAELFLREVDEKSLFLDISVAEQHWATELENRLLKLASAEM
ncbi:hypothetical protein [Roseibium sp.]|uniref:hypothetical protein n=1 Tax=Roseibium sp. TaxID=1936156 RepID=UPI003A96A40B